MAISVLTDSSTANNSRTLSWTIPTLAVNDVIVVMSMTWDSGITLANPSGTGLAFGARLVNPGTGSHDFIGIWAMKATSSGSSVAVTQTVSASCMHTGVLIRFPAADGYDLAGTPNVLAPATVAQTGSITGTSGNIAVVAVGDWNGADGSSRVWTPAVGSGTTEALYARAAGDNTQYFAYSILTGSSTTVGITTPAGLSNAAIGAVEILAGGGGGPTNFNGTAAIAATDTVSGAGAVGKVATAAIAGTAVLATAGLVGKVATAAIAATATVAASGVVGTSSGASLASTATITAAGSVTTGLSSGASLSATDSLSAAGVVGANMGATIGATDTITAVGTVGTSAGASMAATATVTAAGTVVAGGVSSGAALAATDTIAATGVVGRSSSASLTGTATITAAGTTGSPAYTGTANLAGTDTITAAGRLGLNTAATVTSTVVITAAGVVGVRGTAAMNGIATLTATGFNPDAAHYEVTTTVDPPQYAATVDRPQFTATADAPQYTAQT